MSNGQRTLHAILIATAVFLAPDMRGADEPHSRSYIGATSGTNSVCLKCHATHKAAGSNLTTTTSNEAACASCHNLGGIAAAFPLEWHYKADFVNDLGSSHAWNVPAANANAGTSTPTSVMKNHMDGSNITCSTCHDQHHTMAGSPADAGTQNKSAATRVAGTETGTVTYTATAGANGKGYLIDVVEVGGVAGAAKFRISNDGGLTWFGYSGGAWVAYAPGNAVLTGSNVMLNDGANLAATFAGTFVIGDRWRLYVGYPFLRVALDSGNNTTGTKFCRDCHSAWAMDHAAVRTYDGTPKSHPVGVALGANGEGYDRVAPLDGDGGAAGSDGNATNDLLLAADGTVQCLSCHGVHHADGNTETVDQP